MIFEQKNSKAITVSAHLLIWLLLLLFPFLLTDGEPADFNRIIRFTWTPMFFYAVIFYFNHLYFIDKFLFTRKTFVFIVVNICIIAASTWIIYEVKEFLSMFRPEASGLTPNIKFPRPSAKMFVYKDALSLIIPIIISIALKSTENWTKTANEKKEIEQGNLHSELQHLKYQLQPHFFFNSLNTIYSLVEQSPEMAQETIHSLSKLMRYMLYESDTEKSNLADEIEFMKQYINLMKLRISDKTSVHANLPAINENYRITPLLFISLIENAFKHGVSAIQPSEIFFSLSTEGKMLRFFAENTNFPKSSSDKSGSGIGLMNLKKRLELSYPGKYNFKAKVEGHLYSVLLEIDTSE